MHFYPACASPDPTGNSPVSINLIPLTGSAVPTVWQHSWVSPFLSLFLSLCSHSDISTPWEYWTSCVSLCTWSCFFLHQTYPQETVALSKRPSNNEIPENQSAQFWQHSKLPRALLSLSLCWGGNSINLHFRWTSETSIVLPPSWCLRDTPFFPIHSDSGLNNASKFNRIGVHMMSLDYRAISDTYLPVSSFHSFLLKKLLQKHVTF